MELLEYINLNFTFASGILPIETIHTHLWY